MPLKLYVFKLKTDIYLRYLWKKSQNQVSHRSLNFIFKAWKSPKISFHIMKTHGIRNKSNSSVDTFRFIPVCVGFIFRHVSSLFTCTTLLFTIVQLFQSYFSFWTCCEFFPKCQWEPCKTNPFRENTSDLPLLGFTGWISSISMGFP